MRNGMALGVVVVLLVIGDVVLNDGKTLHALQLSIQSSLTSLVD
jgi:hypothetical protein